MQCRSPLARVRLWSHFALIACSLWLLQHPERARAYCRESLASQSSGECVENPSVPFLFWKRNCLTLRFNENFWGQLPLLSESTVRAIFKTSFATWAAVDCGRSGMPFYVEQASGTTSTDRAEFVYDRVNESVILAHSKGEWASLPDHDPNALALTLVWHDKITGEILDVDMELNTGIGDFKDCAASGCGFNNIDLQNTVTHEAGHVLGLGHSHVGNATMAPQTGSGSETTKRTLKADDKAGYCALMLPQWRCSGSDCTCPPPPIVPSHRTVRTCGCRTLGTSGAGLGWLPALAVLALLGARRSRLRRP